MDAAQILILAGVGVAVLFFLRTPYAKDPVKLHGQAAPGGFKALIAAIVLGGALYVGAMATGAASTGGYERAVAAGDGSLFLLSIVAVLGLFALASEGILTKLLIPLALAIMAWSVLA
jgi:hypothetical protein